MPLSLLLASIWAVAANVIAMFPSKSNHWPAAYGLIAAGLPILVYTFWQMGPWVGLAVLAAGASILRWPVRYLLRWLRRIASRRLR